MYNKSAYYIFLILHVFLGILSLPTLLFIGAGIGSFAFVFLYIGVILTQLTVPMTILASKKPMSRFLMSAAVIQVFSFTMCLNGAYINDKIGIGNILFYLLLLSAYYTFLLIEAFFIFRLKSVLNFLSRHSWIYVVVIVVAVLVVLSFVTMKPWLEVYDFFIDE